MLERRRAASSCLSFTPEPVGDHGEPPLTPAPPRPPPHGMYGNQRCSAFLTGQLLLLCQEGTEAGQQPGIRYRPAGPRHHSDMNMRADMLLLIGWSGFQAGGVSCLGVEDVAPNAFANNGQLCLCDGKQPKNRIQDVDKKENEKRQQERREEESRGGYTKPADSPFNHSMRRAGLADGVRPALVVGAGPAGTDVDPSSAQNGHRGSAKL